MLYATFMVVVGGFSAMLIAAGELSLRWRRQRAAAAGKLQSASALRVLFVHRDLPIHGGVPQCLTNLARALDPQRIAFHVASFNPPSEGMRGLFRELQIDTHCVGDRGYLSPAKQMRQLIEDHGIDIIVATTFKAYLCAKIAVRNQDVGVVFWIHTVRGSVEGVIRGAIRDYLVKDDPMLFVSRAVRDAQLPASHRGPAEVIYNGVEDVADDPDQQPYGPEMRDALGIPRDALVLAYIAEFVVWKDHATAINTLHELVRRNLNVHLLLMGTGRDIELSRALAEGGVGRDRIHFLGARDDVRRLLGVVDIYIHTSREEGFGLAVVEAMLAARPVAAVRSTGAVIELIDHGKTGVLVEPGSVSALADAVMSLASDPEMCRAMGSAARQSCLQRFDVNAFADLISAFLEESFPQVVRRRRQLPAPAVAAAPPIVAEPAGVQAG